ncbi:MAG TPA: sensor domain-containing diguanylate cyclase [Acidimicrobiales bacterium]|nr:sensor domain-containing diguanylate cyclase [Acidimicrobiales bacterium]
MSSLVGYRIRTARVAVAATYMAMVLLVALPFLPGGPPVPAIPYAALCSVAVAGAALFGFAVPWERLFASGWGEPTFYAWSGLDIVLVTLGCAISGGPTSPLGMLYLLTTIFFAASYPFPGQAALFGLTLACYGALIVAWPHPTALAEPVCLMGATGIVWFMAAFLARERNREMAAGDEARALAEHRAELLAAVARTASDIITLDAESAMAGVVDSLVGLGFDVANFCVLEDSGRRYRVAHPRGLPDEYGQSVHSASLGMVALVSARRGTVVVNDYASHPLAVPALRSLAVRSVVATPVWVGGELTAVLVAASRTTTTLPATDIEVVEMLAAQISRALENVGRFQAEREAVSRALADSRTDELTRLGNRRHANALLASLRPGDALVIIDLDHFKSVNDAFGHAAGDALLVALADHLRHAVRGGDDVARYGGEEFLIVLRQASTEALVATERLFVNWREAHPGVTFSAGVALHTGDRPPSLTLGRADAALYAAKLMGRDRACEYGPDLESGSEVTLDS